MSGDNQKTQIWVLMAVIAVLNLCCFGLSRIWLDGDQAYYVLAGLFAGQFLFVLVPHLMGWPQPVSRATDFFLNRNG